MPSIRQRFHLSPCSDFRSHFSPLLRDPLLHLRQRPCQRPLSSPTQHPTPTPDLKGGISDVVANIGPSVVQVKTLDGTASGVIVDPSGYILTNYHVVGGPSLSVTLQDGRTFQATLVGFHEPKDLAVLHIDAQDLPAQPISQLASTTQLGEEVVALGYPLGGSFTVTKGIVSAFVESEVEGLSYVQTDAPVNPGNSGGPLVNSRGNLVGLVTSKFVDVGIEGVSFAIWLPEQMDTVDSLIQGLSIAEPTATPVATKVVQSYPKGWSIEVAKRWKQDKVEQSFDWLHREFKKGDWLFWVDSLRSGAVLSIRSSDDDGTPESYMERLLVHEIRSKDVEVDLWQVSDIVLTNGVPATRFELTVEADGYDFQGTYASTWIIAVLDNLTVAVEVLVFGDEDRTRDELEAALAALEVFQPG